MRSVIIIYLSFVPLITGKIASFTGKRSFSRLHSMSKDGMSRDGRKMSPMHATLKAGVNFVDLNALFDRLNGVTVFKTGS